MPLNKEGLRRLSGLTGSVNNFKVWFNEQSMFSRAGIGIFLGFIFCWATYALLIGNACGIYVDGRLVAVADNGRIAKKTLAELLEDKSDQAGTALLISERVTYRGIRASQEEVLGNEELKDTLSRSLSFSANGTMLVIDGEERICLKDREEAEKLLEWLKSTYPADPDEQVSFKEKVELLEKVVDERDLLTAADAKNLLLYGSAKIEQYEVKDGDTAWDIAERYDMFPEQLQISNPGVDTWHLNIGQMLKLSKEVPMLTVVATRELTTEEEIPYQVVEEIDDGLMPGEKKIIMAGTKGLKNVTYFITKENGFETDRQVLEQEILSEPTTEVVLRGSQILLASRAGGRMSWPCGGGVLSSFGIRGGRMHKGVDLGGSEGDYVGAAAGGTVIYAAYGYEGGYGNNVEISHGGGFVTRYAHLSSVDAYVGQTVERGEMIGRVGNTGNSYGAHLHFEVQVNGELQDPVGYLQ